MKNGHTPDLALAVCDKKVYQLSYIVIYGKRPCLWWPCFLTNQNHLNNSLFHASENSLAEFGPAVSEMLFKNVDRHMTQVSKKHTIKSIFEKIK